MLLRRLVVIAATLLVARSGSAQGRAFGLEDLTRLVAVRAPALSPDGRQLVYSTGRSDFEENRTISQVWLVDVASRASREILAEQPGARSVTWISNERLAFVARADSGNVAQVYSWDVPGGRARQLTRSPTGIRAFAVSPDGATVAYSADDQPAVKTGTERFNDAFEVKNDDFLTMAAPQPVHLWLQGTDGAAPRRLTSGGWSLATSLSTSGIQWMPDGLALVVQVFDSPHSGDTDKSRVARIAVRDGAPTFLTAAGVRATGPEISPDGRWIAFGSPRDGVPANLRDLHLIAATGGAPRNVSRTLDRPVSPTWLAD
ncbi:MAG: PD40 domain-containing protein, partial [Cytophagaceae bacterium]|nr:PD40 domain-containing protein [Gemmatimonadaceae bacterium]